MYLLSQNDFEIAKLRRVKISSWITHLLQEESDEFCGNKKFHINCHELYELFSISLKCLLFHVFFSNFLMTTLNDGWSSSSAKNILFFINYFHFHTPLTIIKENWWHFSIYIQIDPMMMIVMSRDDCWQLRIMS